MRNNLLPVAALLLGTLFLFLGNGLQGLLLPVRGTAEGYPTTILGLFGTLWPPVSCLAASSRRTSSSA